MTAFTGEHPTRSVWLVRHGIRLNMEKPTWGLKAKRPDDPPLSRNGVKQARETARFLSGNQIRRLFSSPFYRAVQTAHPIANALDLPILIEDGFSEWLNPAWQRQQPKLLSTAALAKRFPRIDTSYAPLGTARYPEYDEAVDVYARVKETLGKVLKLFDGDILIVAHGATIVQAARALTGTSDGLDYRMCAVNRIVCEDDAWRIALATSEHLTVHEDRVRFD
jgi:broad specificity phosphatase PhoE